MKKFLAIATILIGLYTISKAQVYFEAADYSGCAPFEVTIGNVNVSGGQTPYSYTWSYYDNQGNPYTATGLNPGITLTDVGSSQQIELYVIDANTDYMGSYWQYFDVNGKAQKLQFNNAKDSVCPGESFYVQLPNNNAYDIIWYMGDGTVENYAGQGMSHSYASLGDYYITVTYTDMCGSHETIDTMHVSDNVTLIGEWFDFYHYRDSICPNDQVVFNISQGYSSYEWDFGDGNTATGFDYDSNNKTHQYDAIGDYPVAVTITNACGFDTVLRDTVYIRNTLTYIPNYFDLYTDYTCPNTEVGMSTDNGYQNYYWNFSDGTSYTTGLDSSYTRHLFTDLGKNFVSVTIFNGCGYDTTLVDSIYVTDTITVGNIMIDLMKDSICPGDLLFMDADWDGYANYKPTDIVWNFSNGMTKIGEEQAITFSSPGEYIITLTISNQCGNSSQKVDTIHVRTDLTTPSLFQAVAIPEDGTCFGSETGFITFPMQQNVTWDFGDGTSSSDWDTLQLGSFMYNTVPHTYTSTGLFTASYTVTNGCGVTSSSTVTALVSESALVGNDVWDAISSLEMENREKVCAGDEFWVTGMGAQNYTWHFGDGTIRTSSGNLEKVYHSYADAGIYNLKVVASNSCGLLDSVEFALEVSPATFTLSSEVNNPICSGGQGEITVSATGSQTPYFYIWSHGYEGATVTGLEAGNYSVQVVDASGCYSSENFNIAPSGTPLALTGTKTNVVCALSTGGAVDLSVSGGTTPYTYNWSTGATTQDITGLRFGVVGVSVVDANGCSDTKGFTIVNTATGIDASATITDASCFGAKTGAVKVQGVGGKAPYSAVWSNGFTGLNNANIYAGNYYLYLKDANGCRDTSSYTVAQPSQILVSVAVSNTSCGNDDGVASVSVAGGSSPYDIVWSTGEQTQIITDLAAGIYGVNVTDATGCSVTKMASVSDDNGPSITVNDVTNITCPGNKNGAIDVSIFGGSTPYQIEWSHGAFTEDVSGLAAGPYELIVTDAGGCIAMISEEIEALDAIEVTATIVDASCGSSDGSAEISISGGTSPYTYVWSTGANGASMTGMSANIYSVAVTDINNCLTAKLIEISEIGAPTIIIDSITHVRCGNDNGEIFVTAEGGEEPYSYAWSHGATTAYVSGLSMDTFNIAVTGSNGCKAMKSVEIKRATSYSDPICLVTVDTVTGTNLLAWEKISGAEIAGYNIYKESTQSEVYYFLDYVSFDSLSVFVDSLSDPTTRSWRYKISTVDTCGIESAMSDPHKTMHLTINLGLNNSINLIWDHYQGYDFSTYFIYRDSEENGWELIDSVPSTSISYTDTALTGLSKVNYIVEAIHPNGCNATLRAASYNSSRSNKSKQVAVPGGPADTTGTGITIRDFEISSSVYPNPNDGEFMLSIKTQNKADLYITVTDIVGKQIDAFQLAGFVGETTQTMNLSGIDSGIYTVSIVADGFRRQHKVIIK